MGMKKAMVSMPVDTDLGRFRKIVRGKVRENLKKYLIQEQIISQQGKRGVVVPIPHIQLPYFRFGKPEKGVGQGEGEEGEVLSPGDRGDGAEGAGAEPGRHFYEAELSIEELADILGEALELPRIEPKKHQQLETSIDRYTSVRRVGPESLRYMRRTMKEVLKRAISSGIYDPDDPVLVPIKADKRYRSWKSYPAPDSSAVVFLMRDFSGSMTTEKKRLVRVISFWLDTWLRRNYRKIIVVYIGHDTHAYILDAEQFFSLTTGGGTHISSGYELVSKLIKSQYDPTSWNLYGFHFTDGENFDYDNDRAIKYLRQDLVPVMNLFGYCGIKSGFIFGAPFADRIKGAYADGLPDNLILDNVDNDDHVFGALKNFLGKGK